MRGKFIQWLPIVAVFGICGLILVFSGEIRELLLPSQDVSVASQDDRTVEMRTVLGRDGIPSIDSPSFVSVEQANRDYRDNELVMGVEINGDARAYSIPMLSRHEIVNDVVGGQPIAVTW